MAALAAVALVALAAWWIWKRRQAGATVDNPQGRDPGVADPVDRG
jgi:hypothetical protein